MSAASGGDRVVLAMGALAVLAGAAMVGLWTASGPGGEASAQAPGCDERADGCRAGGEEGALFAEGEEPREAAMATRPRIEAEAPVEATDGRGAARVAGGGWEERRARQRRHEVAIRGYVERQAWARAREEAQALLAFDPFHDEARGVRDEARRWLQGRRAGAGAGGEPAPGAKLRSTHGFERAQGELQRLARAAIEARHSDPSMAAAIRLYALDGRLDQAIEELRRLPSAEGDKPEESVDRSAWDREEITAALIDLEATLQQIRGQLREGRLADADRLLQRAIGIDRRLAPWSELGSEPLREARRAVARAWLEEGKLRLDRSQRRLAAAAWQRGIRADPTLLEVQMAARRLGEGR